MKTEVKMVRRLFDFEIKQKSKSGYFSLTDLASAGSIYKLKEGGKIFQIHNWLKSKQTQAFIKELKETFGERILYKQNKEYWGHPYLFIDMALAINPKLKIEVYTWLKDHLLEQRNLSGDSYRYMSGALYEIIKDRKKFPKLMKQTALKVREACEVENWESATEEQLKLRNTLHNSIAHCAKIMKSPKQSVLTGIKIGLEQSKKLKQIGDKNG